jgi:hypothetical protein
MKEAVKEQYGKDYTGNFSLKLEDGSKIDEQHKNDPYQSIATLEQNYINRFSTIQFLNPGKKIT